MYDPQKDINKLTLLDRLNEEEKRIKGFKIYKHKYFSIKFYSLSKDLTFQKISQIKNLIEEKISKGENQNLVIYIEQMKNNYNKQEKTYYNLIKEISKINPEDQPLLLFIHHDNDIIKKNYIDYLDRLNKEDENIYKKIDKYSLTVLRYEEYNFKNVISNEIWDAVSFYNQIPYLTFPSLESEDFNSNDINHKKFSNNLYTLNILLVGDSGAGKSTFINIIKGKKIAYESTTSEKKTVQINEYLIENFFNNNSREIKLWLKLIDTLGFSTENIEKEKLLN